MLPLLLFLCESSLKVSDINVRLPFRLPGSPPPKYVITAFDSSAKWFNSNNKLVTIQENPKNRQNSSITVEVICEGPHSEAVTLYANSSTDTVEVNVYIDSIYSAIITTTARVLYANSSVDLFTINAFDKVGNTFTSIDSYKVEWVYNSTELRQVPLNETDLFTLYSDGLPPCKILVQGQVLGSKSLKAIINNKVHAPEIQLDIVEPIYLMPKQYTMLPGSKYYIKLCSRNGIRTNSDLEKCKKKLSVPQKKYIFESDNTSIASIEQNGLVTSTLLGKSYMRVIDQIMPHNRGQMVIHVVNPSTITIPNQYIIVGQKPSVEEAIFKDYKGEILSKPDNIKWNMTDNYKQVGKHTVYATAFGVTTSFIVTTCEEPRFNPSKVHIPLHQDGYSPILLGGSGSFTFRSTNETVLKYSFSTIKSLCKGRAQLIAYDDYLKVEAVLNVHIVKMKKARFEFERREFMVGENITYSFKTTTKSGKAFDYLSPIKVIPNDLSIVQENSSILTAISAGFTNITCVLHDFEETILIGVYEHVQVATIIQFTINEPFDLAKQHGPMEWPLSSKPEIQVVCGHALATIEHDTNLVLRDKYSGRCTLTITNKVSKYNPNPRPDSINFTVQAEKIVEFGIIVTDPKSLNNPESGLALSSIPELSSLTIKEYQIPVIHKISLKVIAFAEGHVSLGEFSHPMMTIKDQDGNNFSTDSFITQKTIITVTPPSRINASQKTVTLIPIYNISSKEFVSVYQYAKSGSAIEIYNGTKSYIIASGSEANIEKSTLTLYPSLNIERKVTICDQYIPEYSLTINVVTEEPAKLVIDGPSFCIVGDLVNFVVHVYSMRNNEIQADGLRFSTETNGLTPIGNMTWSLQTLFEGRIEITISSEGVVGTKSLDVLDQIKFKPDNRIMYVGETFIPNVIGGSVSDQLVYQSTNSSIANVVRGVLRAVSPGQVIITATVPNLPLLGIANMSVRVLDIKGVHIIQFPEQPYVDSFIHLTPILETDAGDQSPHLVSWIIAGSNNWEKLYDGSVIIRADQAVDIIATCSAHEYNKTIIIPIDYRLEFSTPLKLSLPHGSNYSVNIKHNLPVDFSIQSLTNPKAELIEISKEGLISATNLGQFVIVARFKTQFVATIVSVSDPRTIYLRSEGATLVRPILLDNDGQEYSTSNGVAFDFNISNEAVITDGSYSFAIDSPTYISIIAHNEHFSVFNSTLLSDNLISPQSPIVMKGAETEFICAAKRPIWKSANSHAATITATGVSHAIKRGRSVIYCTEEIYTPLTVTELQSIEILEREPLKHYSITPIFAGAKYESSSVRYPSDLQITCTWDAPDCGRIYAVSPNNMSESYCAVELFNKRRCPSIIHLKALATSRASDTEVSGYLNVKYDSDLWGVPSFIRANVSKVQPTVIIPIKIKSNEVRIIGSVGLRTNFSDNSFVITADFRFFKEKGHVTLEYIGNNSKYQGDRLEIEVNEDSKNSLSFFTGQKKSFLDRLLFNTSIILTCIFGFYAAYMLGQSGNLPPLSPYKGKSETKQ